MEINREIVEKAYWLCVNHYGYSKWQEDVPYLVANYRRSNNWGCFEPWTNIIRIYLSNLDNVVDLSHTVIHEYAHYLQRPTWITRYLSIYKYEDNPYEIQADAIADRDWIKCYREITE